MTVVGQQVLEWIDKDETAKEVAKKNMFENFLMVSVIWDINTWYSVSCCLILLLIVFPTSCVYGVTRLIYQWLSPWSLMT